MNPPLVIESSLLTARSDIPVASSRSDNAAGLTTHLIHGPSITQESITG